MRLADVEAALRRIPSVTGARVVTGPGGRITEVHVLARRDRSPKQLVRDVQSVALTSFGVEVDYRTVSVVQLEDGGPVEQPADGPAPPPRPILARVASEVVGHTTHVTVAISADGRELVGTARGPASIGSTLVSRAVIEAIEPLLGGTAIEVEQTRILGAGDHEVAVCIVRTAGRHGDMATAGSAVVRRDAADAIARATMDALNRLVAGLTPSHDGDDGAAPTGANGIGA